MQAVFLIENKQYEEALELLVKTKVIYEKMSHFKDTLEAIIYREKVTQLDTLIRACLFNLKGSQMD
jgi:hypothetical protein